MPPILQTLRKTVTHKLRISAFALALYKCREPLMRSLRLKGVVYCMFLSSPCPHPYLPVCSNNPSIPYDFVFALFLFISILISRNPICLTVFTFHLSTYKSLYLHIQHQNLYQSRTRIESREQLKR